MREEMNMSYLNEKRGYRTDIDFLKGIAIIAVVLYHMGLLESGYLGVDAFLVINGFLIVPKVWEQISKDEFRYFDYLKRRLLRLYPVLLAACIISLIVGYIGMFPDNYLTISESVVASLFFSNNILAYILTGDYWDWTNEFKPLMHTWYLGIIVEMYFFVPLVLILVCKLSDKIKKSKDRKHLMVIVLEIMIALSLLLFLCPFISANIKFYFFPFRLFEFLIGGVCGVFLHNERHSNVKRVFRYCVLGGCGLYLLILFYGAINLNISNTIALIVTVIATSIVLVGNVPIKECKFTRLLGLIGKCSYSIFIWHQIILAFTRYYITCDFTWYFIIAYFIVLAIITFLSYKLIEKRTYKTFKLVICIVIVMIPSFFVYLNAGVVRDIPELDIYKEHIERRKFPHYVDRIYSYDGYFKDLNKINVLLIGNSYARDFANILLESPVKDDIEISYMGGISSECTPTMKKMMEESDYIFFYMNKSDIPDYFWKELPVKVDVYGIGTKNFGDCNGIFYKNRYQDGYFEQAAVVQEAYALLEDEMQKEWGEKYISLLQYVQNEDGTVQIFTDTNKYISYDCYHLSQAGAQFFARKIDFSKIIVDKE